LEVSQKLMNRKEFISSDIFTSFKKNLNIPLYIAPTVYRYRKIIQNGAIFIAIRTFATFVGQILQVFLWRDLEGYNLGNRLLGLKKTIPARDSSSSSYLT